MGAEGVKRGHPVSKRAVPVRFPPIGGNREPVDSRNWFRGGSRNTVRPATWEDGTRAGTVPERFPGYGSLRSRRGGSRRWFPGSGSPESEGLDDDGAASAAARLLEGRQRVRDRRVEGYFEVVEQHGHLSRTGRPAVMDQDVAQRLLEALEVHPNDRLDYAGDLLNPPS